MKCLKLVADRSLQQLTPNRLTPTLNPKPIPNPHMTLLTLTLPCIMISFAQTMRRSQPQTNMQQMTCRILGRQ